MKALSLKRVRPALMAAALVTLWASLLISQTAAPDTPAGRQLARWLATFNGGDRTARQEFYKEHWAYTPNQNFYEDLLDQTGGLELLRIEESTPTRTIAIARQIDGDAVARLTLEVEADVPHRILRFTSRRSSARSMKASRSLFGFGVSGSWARAGETASARAIAPASFRRRDKRNLRRFGQAGSRFRRAARQAGSSFDCTGPGRATPVPGFARAGLRPACCVLCARC